jgi:DNA-binding NarL/FixJ family response regulator
MYDDQESIVKMLSLGAKGYIGKDIDAQELNHALLTINEVGFYYSNNITKHLINALQKKEQC